MYELREAERAAGLFAGWQETMIWSCLQGIMGSLYVDSLEKPASAMALLGDFCFLAGKPSREGILHRPRPWRKTFMILVPQTEEWARLVEACCGESAKRVTRYAFKKDAECFDREALLKAADGLPAGYELKLLDEPLFWYCRQTAWCRDWVAQYTDYARYQEYGLGVVIVKEGVPVSGASSYSGYRGGIEIEIDTRADFRRKGLARICGAKLILECLERGLYPSWDAHNPGSAALAKKLGYRFDRAYAAYEMTEMMGSL